MYSAKKSTRLSTLLLTPITSSNPPKISAFPYKNHILREYVFPWALAEDPPLFTNAGRDQKIKIRASSLCHPK